MSYPKIVSKTYTSNNTFFGGCKFTVEVRYTKDGGSYGVVGYGNTKSEALDDAKMKM
jgi:hypothetical protein